MQIISRMPLWEQELCAAMRRVRLTQKQIHDIEINLNYLFMDAHKWSNHELFLPFSAWTRLYDALVKINISLWSKHIVMTN